MNHKGKALICPCCGQQPASPSLPVIIDTLSLSPSQACVLEMIWRGKGEAVQTERICEAMFRHNPNGMPEWEKAYIAFKITLCHLRKRISGTGIRILNVGYGRGYRIEIDQRLN